MKYETYSFTLFQSAIANAVREGLTFRAIEAETLSGTLFIIEYTGGY